MIAFYPGSFDPVTRGHMDIIKRALAFCPHLVIGIGQNNQKKTLFTADERVALLNESLNSLSDAERKRVTVKAYTGTTVSEASHVGAAIIIKGLRGATDFAFEEKMAIVNRHLDNSIDTIYLFTDNALRDVSSSTVKEMALSGVAPDKFDHYLTLAVRDALLKRLQA